MIKQFIESLESSPDYQNEIVHRDFIPSSPPESVPIPAVVPPVVLKNLEDNGISGLYRPQIETLQCIEEGKNPLLVGASASGKTLAFHYAVAKECIQNPDAGALYILPTRALVRNQKYFLDKLLAGIEPSPQVHAYDGGTPHYERKGIREHAQILLTTPDVLHGNILPSHLRWSALLARLSFVCVDDIHTYRGIWGTQCSLVFRRLHRILRHYRAEPAYLASSFPIDIPIEHAQKLMGVEFHEIPFPP